MRSIVLVGSNRVSRTLLMSGLCALACSAPEQRENRDIEARLGVTRQAIVASDAINARWQQLGGAATVGAPTSAVLPVPGSSGAEYQTFVNGVIVVSEDYGAVYLSQAIFDKWLTLQAQVNADGANLFDYVGLPVRDYTSSAASSEAGFERGQVLVDATGARVVYGNIYQRYLVLAPLLGLPRSEEAAEVAGGRYQVFEQGEVHWRTDLGAFMVSGPVLQRWLALGGAAGALGFPNADSGAVVQGGSGTAIGQSGRFEQGVIYQSAATGAREMTGKLVEAYESQFGGPAGWLGFPRGSEAVAGSGDHFVDFENGVLVNHITGPVSQQKVYPFGDLEFWLERIAGSGDDCIICGSQDTYAYVTVDTSDGTLVNHRRIPGSGNGGSSFNVRQGTGIGPARGNLAVDVSVEAWDEDLIFSDDFLGSVQHTYSIDNLWGILEGLNHRGGNMQADFNIRNHYPFDTSDFRGQMWWSFENFRTNELSYDQYAATFADVDPDESVLLHPFNHLYYSLAYKGIASNGNCFGMSLESIFSQVGRSPYTQPIHQYFADTETTGNELSPIDAAHVSLINQINIKHGYQLGANQVLWTVGMFTTGLTHDPLVNYFGSQLAQATGNYPIMNIFDSYLFGNGHSVRPYSWEGPSLTCEKGGPPPCFRIHIADPNFPTGDSTTDDFIEIDASNHYEYRNYSGGVFTGGRMFFTPFALLAQDQVTPFGAVLQMITDGVFITVGSDGQMEQVTDDAGRTFFKPGLGGPPTQWDDIVQDSAARIPDFAPIMLANDDPLPLQMYAGRKVGAATHTYDLVPTPGAAPNAPYTATVESGRMSAYVSIPGSAGSADRVTFENIGTADRAISVTSAAASTSKAITFTVAGAEKQRWAELSSLGMAPTQNIRLRTRDAGYRLLIDNDGPATSAHLTVRSGPGASPVNVGVIQIPSGESSVEFKLPKTTLSLSGEVFGKQGWLVAPVTVTLDTQDFSGKGIDAIEYSTDNVNWTKYTGPFPYENQGISTLYYRARDKNLNQERAQQHAFKIDTRRPATTGSLSTTGIVRLAYTVTDPVPGSGVAGLHLRQNSSPPVESFVTAASGTLPLSTGCSALEFWGEDVAGNETAPHVNLGDSVAPVFTFVPGSVTSTRCTAAAGLVLGNATARDDCGPVSVTNNAPAQFPLGTTIVTWTARDAAGNASVRTQTVSTELGDDASCCPAGSTVIRGTSNNDTLNGGAGNDCILGLGGQDTLRGFGGADALSGGEGDDQLFGGDGSDWLVGGSGQDIVRGENGDDVVRGGDGDDQVFGGSGDDRLSGGQGQDRLFCEAGNDSADGGTGDDTIDGGAGNDSLNGGADHDTYFGGAGVNQCVQDGGDRLNACVSVAP